MATTPIAGRSVRRQLRGQVRVEHGAPSAADVEKVAVLAHWSATATVTHSVSALVAELQKAGYCVVVSTSAEVAEPLVWGDEVDRGPLVVLRKPNVGYDFGSWSIGLQQVPGALRAEHTLLLNDSMAGPFVGLGPLLERLEQGPYDVWGLTENDQFAPHLQSYFLGFRAGVLADRPLRSFWHGIRHQADKQQIIFDYELGLSRLLRDEGYVMGAAFDRERVVPSGENPVIRGWQRLLDLGFPFLKREILRTPDVAPEGSEAPAELHERFGIEVADWVDEVAA